MKQDSTSFDALVRLSFRMLLNGGKAMEKEFREM